jgi:hypothetical protein
MAGDAIELVAGHHSVCTSLKPHRRQAGAAWLGQRPSDVAMKLLWQLSGPSSSRGTFPTVLDSLRTMVSMLRIYLDQNKWVELSRSRRGRFSDDLGDVWHVAKAGVDAGLLSFPLSDIHYYETHKRVDQASRWRLAATMVELSHGHTLAGSSTLVPAEVTAAAYRIATGSPPPRRVEAFGLGAAHALGVEPGRFSGLSSLDELEAAGMPDVMLDLVRDGVIDATELALLARTEASPAASAIAAATRKQMGAVGRRFADAQRDYASALQQHGLAHQRDEGLSRFDLVDVIPLFNRAFAALGKQLTPEQFKDIEAVEGLLREVPSKWVVREMRRVRHRNAQQAWTENDLNDVNALSGAVVYCDVVVTERQWTHHLNQEGIARLHDTVVISDLRKLPELMVTDSRV